MIVAAHQTMLAPPALPYDAEVEYLESSGTQYVDTGYAPVFPSNLEYRARIRYHNTTTRMIMGLQGGMYIGVVDGKYQCNGGGNITVDAPVSANAAHDFGAVFHLPTEGSQPRGHRVDWTMDNLSGRTTGDLFHYLPATATIWLFWANDASSLRGASAIYSFQILADGVLVRDYQPVRVGTTGYLYDKVSKQLFGNAGTGSFVLGPDK